ncbi:hypothetical protein RIF29_03724 [Crotalaria pallida]|uniref:Uncharacterized protein n=1 Tax=Crotalaria pallida TaxID=3830 RepID=A0AAN9J1K2_CROPI
MAFLATADGLPLHHHQATTNHQGHASHSDFSSFNNLDQIVDYVVITICVVQNVASSYLDDMFVLFRHEVDNGNAIVGKGKSAFVSYQRSFRRTHVKRNLNKDYDVMLIGESSNSSTISHSRSNETVSGSNSKDSLETIPNPCDESVGVTQTGRKQ